MLNVRSGESRIDSGDFICSAAFLISDSCTPRILKLPSCLDNIEDVANLFVTCCALHNMLLLRDRPFFDSQNAPEVLGNVISSRHYSSGGAAADVVVDEDLDVSGVGMHGAGPQWFFHDGSAEPTHFTLRDKLANHYNLSQH
jgi:hypothetical protein